VAGIDWLTYDHFAGHVGDVFGISAADGPDVPVTLVEATQGAELGGPGPAGQHRRQFSLVFHAPTSEVWHQGTYELRHQDLGELELFLVPIGTDAEGVLYEAAFA
jgi:hypothetical protein